MAIADNKIPEDYIDGYLFSSWIVSHARMPRKPRKALLIVTYSVCIVSIIRLVVLSRLDLADVTCKISGPRKLAEASLIDRRELRQRWHMDCYGASHGRR